MSGLAVRRLMRVDPERDEVARLAASQGSVRVDATFFRDLLWNMQNGVVAIDREGRLVVMNAVAYRILGLAFDTGDVGRPIETVLATHPDLARILVTAFEVPELPNRAELRIEPLGQVLGYTLSHVRDARSVVIGAALMFRDLTSVEQLEERERLRDRLAVLGEMAAAIAHEVKNPLAGIQVMAGVLRRELRAQPDAQAALTDIIREAEAANSIVVKVLEFVRPVRLQPEPVPLAELLDAAIGSAERHAARGQVDVSLEIADGLVALQGDRQLLHQLFTNLVTNAYEALEGRGTIVVRVTHPILGFGAETRGPLSLRHVAVDVIDDGPGMSAETLDHIFSPFFTTKAKGSGLGLPLARKIVDAHGGRIEVTTPSSGGTRFRVLLPFTPDLHTRTDEA
jgi:two-component system nitrogen regulation sensor histidine kinase GlnL